MESYINHPGYVGSRNAFKDDIALIRLDTVVPLSASVDVVCLPIDRRATARSLSVSNLRSGLDGKKSFAVGWGRKQFDDDLTLGVSYLCFVASTK